MTIGYPYRRLAEVMLPLGASPSSFGQIETSDGGGAVGVNGKTGLVTVAWAAECGPKAVRVNAVAPGPTRTPDSGPMGDELDELAAKLPRGRPATPDEIAAAALFNGPDEASSVNGAVLAADGGRTAI